MIDYPSAPCLGLTADSTNEEICRAAFDFAHRIGYMSFATTASDGKTPTVRGLEVHYLDDSGALYVGASRGKHFYDEMERSPIVSALAIDQIAVRISSRLEKVFDQPLYDRYWELNQGTKKMYHKDLSNFQLYRFASGEGEVFHVYRDDAIARVRFSFGGAVPRPWAYEISGDCTGCGICAANCMMDTIHMNDGRAELHHYGCNECGICYNSCPIHAIRKQEFV